MDYNSQLLITENFCDTRVPQNTFTLFLRFIEIKPKNVLHTIQTYYSKGIDCIALLFILGEGPKNTKREIIKSSNPSS